MSYRWRNKFTTEYFFSKLKLDRMKEFQEFFNDDALMPFVGSDKVVTTIEAPVMMMIPIAIYI